MQGRKIKILLDADVIHHFVKGGYISLLPKIFPEFQFVILDIVKRELPFFILSALERQIADKKDIAEEIFGSTYAEKKEYFRLTATSGLHLGKGESACMVYCRFHHDVVGSSNTKDITEYCEEFGITYLTTNDFLFYAIQRNLLTKKEATDFVVRVRDMGSKIPVVDFDKYICTKI